MREWQEEAIIIRMGHFNESHLWLRTLLKNGGLLTVFAFGAMRSRKRFCGCLDLFNTINGKFLLSGRNNYTCIAEATLLSAPRALRSDWRSMGVAANCFLFLEACGVPAESAGEIFAVLENLRILLESGKFPQLLPLFFRLKVAAVLGLGPNLENCGRCGNALDKSARFMVEDGQMQCSFCARRAGNSGFGHSIGISQGAIDFLNLVQNSMPGAWQSGALEPQARRDCAMFIDAFIQYHLGLVWENRYFRRV